MLIKLAQAATVATILILVFPIYLTFRILCVTLHSLVELYESLADVVRMILWSDDD